MNRLPSIIIFVVGTLMAFYVMVQLAGSDRSLNQLAKYLAVGVFVFSVINPIRGFAILLFLGCYLEMLKYGAWWQNARGIDMISLNLPPLAAVAGISAGALVYLATGRVRITGKLVALWGGTIFAGCLVGLNAMKGGEDGNAGLGAAANSAAYLMLIPSVVTVLKTREQCRPLLTVAIWMVFPAALYGVYQGLFGYPDWHFDFLAAYRGLTYDPRVYVQPVGTMNSPMSLGTAAAICFCLLFIRRMMQEKSRKFDWILGIVFLGAAALSGRRSALMLIAVFLICALFFKSPRRTLLMYLGGFAALASLYVFANPLIYSIDKLNREGERIYGNDTFIARMVNVGTFNERILGFRNMAKNPDLWSLFGSEVSEDMGKFGHQAEDASSLKRAGNYDQLGDEFVHDGLNRAIISYGVVPMMVAGLVGLAFLAKVHRFQFSSHDPAERKLLRLSVAFLLAILSTLLASQQALTIQPINLLVFLWFGIFAVIATVEKAVPLPAVQASASAPPSFNRGSVAKV